MRHNNASIRAILKYKQTGSMMVTGLFIIVFMAILLAGILRTISVGGMNVAYEVVGLRALNSAQTGVEVALGRLYPLSTTTAAGCTAVTANPINLPNITGFAQCSVTVSCETRSEVNNGTDIFVITSTGQCASAELSTSRQIVIEAGIP